MRFNFAGLNLTFNTKEFSVKRSEVDLSQEDLEFISQDVVERMLEKGEVFYQNKLVDITLDLSDENLQSEALNRIEKDGIFIIPNYLEDSIADELCRIIEKQTESYLSKLGNDEVYEDDLAIIQKGHLVKKNFGELVDSTKPVFDIKTGTVTGTDQGMIDIFNVDRVIKDKAGIEILANLREDGFLNDFLNSLPRKLAIKNINSFLNTGVTRTRGFHADSFGAHVKIFIYLTDVLLFDNGPYTFVKGTHLDTPYRSVNSYLAKDLIRNTDVTVVPFENIYPILAPKGSLIVSDQSGSHRGFPQSLKGSRRVLIINCM